MGLGAVIYIPGFIKIGSGIQKLMGGGIHRHKHTHTHTHGQQRDLISLLYFFQNKESRLKKATFVLGTFVDYAYTHIILICILIIISILQRIFAFL
jgi:hypothetical protein